jgi:hypothetical protein
MNKDRTAGSRTPVRFSNGYSLWNDVNAVATSRRMPRFVFLVQPQGMPMMVVAAAFGVFGWHQVTDFDSNLRFFL